jgi:hypothetical protein
MFFRWCVPLLASRDLRGVWREIHPRDLAEGGLSEFTLDQLIAEQCEDAIADEDGSGVGVPGHAGSDAIVLDQAFGFGRKLARG